MTDYITIKQGSEAPALFFQLGVRDATASSPTFSMAPVAGGARVIDEAAATIANGPYTIHTANGPQSVTYTQADGVLIYAWAAGELDAPGEYETEFGVTIGGKRHYEQGPRIRVKAAV